MLMKRDKVPVLFLSTLAKLLYIMIVVKDFLESSGHMAGTAGPLRPLSSPPALPVSPFLSVSPSPGPGPLVSFPSYGHCNKNYTKRDMSLALEALRF